MCVQWKKHNESARIKRNHYKMDFEKKSEKDSLSICGYAKSYHVTWNYWSESSFIYKKTDSVS